MDEEEWATRIKYPKEALAEHKNIHVKLIEDIFELNERFIKIPIYLILLYIVGRFPLFS